MKIDIKKYAMLGFFVALASLVVTWAFTTFLKVIPQALFSTINVPATTGLTSKVAVTTLGWLGGLVGMNVTPTSGYILLFISSFLIVAVGSLLVDVLNISAKDEWMKLLYVLLIGTALWYRVMIGFVMIPVMSILGLVIYYGLTAYAGLYIAKLVTKHVL